jgi:nitric oxide dioxygenase
MTSSASLDSKTVSLVKTSVPFLVEHGEELTRRFYAHLFEENPEVLAFFNQANQRSGGQQRALASAICAYALHIDNLDALSGAIAEITQKHVSLGIRPEHYPIVGRHLLASIAEMLGDAASDELISAWGTAFGFLAEVFIGVEARQYAAHASSPGGWKGRRRFQVQRKVVESDEITSFHLQPEDGKELPSFLPGQYITLFPSEKNPSASPRNYSLSHRPGRNHFRISVKKHAAAGPDAPSGVFSSFLHTEIDAGDQIELGPPCGVFHLNPGHAVGKTVVLLNAGVGQTPILSMLHSLAESKTARRVLYVHVARSGRHHAFRDEVDSLQKNWPALTVRYLYARPEPQDIKGKHHYAAEILTDSLWKEAHDDPTAEYYFCGSKRFMKEVRSLITNLGVPEKLQHYEFFGPKEALDMAA